MSRSVSRTERAPSKHAGVDAFFIKPCVPATVLAKINAMLGLSN